jgi:hypothetical protein
MACRRRMLREACGFAALAMLGHSLFERGWVDVTLSVRLGQSHGAEGGVGTATRLAVLLAIRLTNPRERNRRLMLRHGIVCR